MENNIIDIIFSPVNLPLTILTGIIILYWVISTLFGMDADLDFDVDVDADIDVDVDSGIEAGNFDVDDISNAELQKDDVVPNRRRELKPWQVFLIYFNFVGVPFLLTTTVFIATWWFLSLLATLLTHSHHNNFGYIWVLAMLIPALILTKLFTQPLKPLFKNLNKDGDIPVDFIGRKGTSLSNISGGKLGNAEILVEGNPMNIYIKSFDGEPIEYRQRILIIREAEDKSFYFAQTYND